MGFNREGEDEEGSDRGLSESWETVGPCVLRDEREIRHSSRQENTAVKTVRRMKTVLHDRMEPKTRKGC